MVDRKHSEAGVPGWLKRRGDELPAWMPTDANREREEIETAFHCGRATAEQLRRALDRAAIAELL